MFMSSCSSTICWTGLFISLFSYFLRDSFSSAEEISLSYLSYVRVGLEKQNKAKQNKAKHCLLHVSTEPVFSAPSFNLSPLVCISMCISWSLGGSYPTGFPPISYFVVDHICRSFLGIKIPTCGGNSLFKPSAEIGTNFLTQNCWMAQKRALTESLTV